MPFRHYYRGLKLRDPNFNYNYTLHKVLDCYWLRLAMRCKNVLLCFLFLTGTVFAAEETPTFSRSSYFRTLGNKQLKGYVVKRLDSPSLLSCGQQCMRYEWCTSTNYKMSSKKDGKGTCELNKHDISLINENINFHDQQGVIFSMLLKVTEVWNLTELAQLTPFSEVFDLFAAR